MFALKFTVLSIIVAVAAGLQCPFQTGVMSSNQIENVLNESLSKLSAQNGPQYSLDIAGSGYAYGSCWFISRYEISATLKDASLKSNTCDIIIWKKNWRSLDKSMTTVIFDCAGAEEVVGTYSDADPQNIANEL